MDHEVAILSPEKTIITYRLSSLGTRILAQILDLLIIYTVLMVIIFGVAITLMPVLGEGLVGLILVIVGVTPTLYFMLMEGLWNGQTLGKKATGIRVRMADGTPITFGAAIGRNLLRPADFLPGFYFVGLLAIFTTPRSQRLGDLAANTVVVQERRGAPIFQPAPHKAGIHAFEAYVGDLRGMTIEEYNVLRRLCDRFPELPENVQLKMMNEVWQPIAAKRGIKAVRDVHPIYLAEAVVMKYGRKHGLL